MNYWHLYIIRSFGLALCFYCCLNIGLVAAYGATEENSIVNFQPCLGITVLATVSKVAITYSVRLSGEDVNHKEISLGIESQPRISIEDYNFDGFPDFSVRYLDEGMKTSTVHRVFLFNPNAMNFDEATPQCADEFLDLRVDKARRMLVSTVYKQNVPDMCETTLKSLVVPNVGTASACAFPSGR